MSSDDAPAYWIESVDRALLLIIAFDDADSLSITEVGRRLDVARSTGYRLLKALEHRGFVRQDMTSKRFMPGAALESVGLAALRRSDLRAVARELLEAVVHEARETAHAVVLRADQALFVDCVEGPLMIRAAQRIGTTLPAHLSAGGLALLAALPDERIDSLLRGRLVSTTGRPVSRSWVRHELEQIRERGWAVNDGYSEAGLRAVAVRVDASATGASGDFAITVAGPESRLTDDRIAEVGKLLLRLLPRA